MDGVSIMGYVLDFVRTGILWNSEGIILAQLPARDKTMALQVERIEEKLYHRRGAKDAEIRFFAFRPSCPPVFWRINGKQKEKLSLRPLRLCGEHFCHDPSDRPIQLFPHVGHRLRQAGLSGDQTPGL